MPYPEWTPFPGSVWLEMASGRRDEPHSVHLGLSIDRDALAHLLDCLAKHVPGYFEDEPTAMTEAA